MSSKRLTLPGSDLRRQDGKSSRAALYGVDSPSRDDLEAAIREPKRNQHRFDFSRLRTSLSTINK